MKRMVELRILLLILLCFSSAYGADASAGTMKDKEAIEKAVLAVHTQMAKASEAQDPEKMFSYILDAGPGTIIQDGTLQKSRQEALLAVKAGLQGVTKVERIFHQVHVTVLTPDVSLVTSDGVTNITLTDGRSFNSPFAVTELFVLRDGQWRLLHGHYSTPNQR